MMLIDEFEVNSHSLLPECYFYEPGVQGVLGDHKPCMLKVDSRQATSRELLGGIG